MGRPLSEWRVRVHDLLADGEWHEQEPVVRDAMRLVPPGPAYRHAEKARQRMHEGPRQRGDESDAIASGQRQIVSQALLSAFKHNRLERKLVDGVYYLRDPRASSYRPSTWSEADDLTDELRVQLKFWERAMKVLPQGEMRDMLLGGDPIASINAALERNGRRGVNEVQEG